MNRLPIVPQKGARLLIEEDSDERLCLRTLVTAWWPGYIILPLIALWGLGAFAPLARWLSPNEFPEIASPPWYIPLLVSLPFVAVFIWLRDTCWLCVEQGVLDYEWRLRSFVLKRRRIALVEITKMECFSDASFDSLEIQTAQWAANLAARDSRKTLEEVQLRIEELRNLALTPEQKELEAKQPPPPPVVKRARDRARRKPAA